MSVSRYDHLTPREREVVTLLAQGMTAKEVAVALVISPGTVEKHVETVMIKLRARNRVQMALLAVADGLIDVAICRANLGDDPEGVTVPLARPRRPRGSA